MADDGNALYEALDERRRARGLTWPQAAQEIGAVSVSTLTGMRGRRSLEGDGVLQMLRWVERSPESFFNGARFSGLDTALPPVTPPSILRFDPAAIHAALAARRAERRLTWRQVAIEIGGINPASLTRLAAGGRVAFPEVMRIVSWIGLPTARFVRVTG
jgi:hypothetical protein